MIAAAITGAIVPVGYDVLAGYDVLGNDRLEIYATLDLHPERQLVCYHLNDQHDPCADE